MCGLNHRNPESIHDTACITYRCFLPDLTRFVTVCCVATGRMNPGHTSQNLKEESRRSAQLAANGPPGGFLTISLM